MPKKLTLNKMLKAKAHERMKALGIPYEQRRKILNLSFGQIRAEFIAGKDLIGQSRPDTKENDDKKGNTPSE